jgi:TonB-dependent SusC/RagA subfamily outer membrane receptor
MRRKASSLFWTVLLALAVAPSSVSFAQESTGGDPRFLLATNDRGTLVSIDISRSPILKKRLTLDLNGASVKNALAVISRESGIRIFYVDNLIDNAQPKRLRAEGITVAAALTDVLSDLDVDVVFARDGSATLVKRDRSIALVQAGSITGIITEAKTGQPVPQAQVSVAGTRLVRSTGDDGRYTIAAVPAGTRTITVRRLGYDPMTREVTVRDNESATLDFALAVATTRLAEIVSTATGEQRRREVGSSIASIRADSLVTVAPVKSFGDLLLGRSPGVLSMEENGAVGGAGRIRIRGLNSALVSNDPIVVIDGARVEASAAQLGGSGDQLGTGGRVTGRLADIDPEEIASVEVVKGPSAATLYGTDAANGVIVITTKRGQTGRTSWTAFMDQGILQQKLDMEDLYPDTYYSFGRSTATNEPLRCTLLMQAAAECMVDSLVSFNPFKLSDLTPFKDGYRQQYGVQVSGGTAGGATYFLSGAGEQEIGTNHMPSVDQALLMAQRGVSSLPDWQIRPNAYKRVNLRGNFTTPVGRRATASFATGFIANKARLNDNNAYRNIGYRDDNDGWVQYGPDNNSRPGYRFAARTQDDVRRFTSSLSTTYNPLDWLALRATAGADLSTNMGGYLLRTGEASPGNNFSQRTAEDYQHTLYTVDLGTTATRQISPAFSSRTSVGMQYNRRTSRSTYIMATDLPLGSETVEGAGYFYVNWERTNNTAVAGGYIEEHLGFRDRLFLTGALRFDSASTFGEDFATATYPKLGVSWVVSDGEVGARLGLVNALRLRASYGAAGIQPGPTDALTLVQTVTSVRVDGPGTAPGGKLVAGNPNVRPERSAEFEGGFDAELAASRVRLEFTGYRRTSTDALVRRPNAPSVGGDRIENLGSVRNEGLELLLSADVLRGGAVGAGFTATGSVNKNRLLRLGEGVLVRNPLAESMQLEEGYPVHGIWGFVIESFADANGNGIIEPGEFQLSSESHFRGSSFPTREGTVSPFVTLFGERLHLSGLVQYRGGFYRMNFEKGNCFAPADSCPAANVPSTPLADQAQTLAYTTRYSVGPLVDEGSYAMLRELSARFTVPASLARYARADGGSVVLAARNVAVLWKAGDVPIENGYVSYDGNAFSFGGPAGPLTTWLLRVHLNY